MDLADQDQDQDQDHEQAHAHVETQPWSLDRLRTVRYDVTGTTVFARSRGVSQRIYHFDTEQYTELAIRRTKGIALRSALSDLVWVRAYSHEGSEIVIGVDSAYIFQQTGSLITPQTVIWGGDGIVPLLDIVSAVLNELEAILSLQIESFVHWEDVPHSAPTDYLSVDHKRVARLIVLSEKPVLDQLEAQARNYCMSYWLDYEKMGRKVHFELGIYIYPGKRNWLSSELADLQLGDLIARQNYGPNSPTRSLRGSLRFRGAQFANKHYEVFIEMNDDDTRLHYGRDELGGTTPEDLPETLAPHEQIELEIHAGRTKILFSELCSVQEGTLIELREHALPLVTLCVMGSPILEGELVHFQDQLMVQVTKRLD